MCDCVSVDSNHKADSANFYGKETAYNESSDSIGIIKTAKDTVGLMLAAAPATTSKGDIPKSNNANKNDGDDVADRAESANKVKHGVVSDNTKGDSANKADTVKSWTSHLPPSSMDKGFLNSLEWKNHKVGGYVLRMGKIYGRWIAAMQWLKNGRVVLTEYTPPMEYVTVVDPKTGQKLDTVSAADVDHDGKQEIAFIHEKLNDSNYHMYTVYSLMKSGPPKLIWKSGGKFGDWINQVSRPGGELWSTHASHDE